MANPRTTARRARRRSNSRGTPASTMLDQGIAITGDLRVKLLGLSLLPIQVRLLISSKDLAAMLGLDWWRDADRKSPSRARNGRAGAR